MNRAGVAGRKRKLREHKFDPAALDPDQPSAFYLPDDEGMLADVTLAVGEHRLPVHSHVLALASPVLRGALLGQADGRTAGASQAAAPTELATPFSDHTLEAVCCFLRLIYFPELAGYKRNLATLGCQTFAGVVRLSHTLQTSRLLSQLKRHATAEGASVEQLVAFQNAAEACQDLADARKRAFELLVSMFARPGAVIPDQVRLVAAQLQWQPLGELFQAVLDGQATGKFTWRFGCFSQGGHNSDYDDDCARYQSPIFAAVGHAWQLVLYVDDLDEDDEGPDGTYLGCYLKCQSFLPEGASVTVVPTFTVLVADPRDDVVSTDESGFEYEVMDDSLGFERMMRWEDVSNPATGFLRGDALRVSVKIRLLPPAAG